MELILFYLFIAVIFITSVALFISKNVIHNAAFLLLSLLSVAGLFVLSASDFLAITQVMIYIGGVLVLLLFGVMYTKNTKDNSVSIGSKRIMPGLFLGLISFGTLTYAILQENIDQDYTIPDRSVVEALGVEFMTKYIFGFELTAILLLVVLIGAVFVAGKTPKNLEEN
ncbi:NADH-quinone oxidoreductase subunit J family protein [Flammeovirga agarivorans]|uniref:NADH-quinone oxidoreductase subunit J n=1 Tax=Flammeovirga agarivorans TaxID=2726742 RepID=A0A7X8XWT4_9BACT|nr:NADH-quinone oxidoreductase subunit J [Flammeovirga agarivorans]NLR92420.1 NADH-quinone oxidoreductase subunit J [Flammeovirga agarivorans]